MFFKRIYDDGLAQACYLIACADSGKAVVVDPARDIDTYLDEAYAHGLDIVGVVETHIHADFLSGARELARTTGATLYVSAETVDGWHYAGLEDIDSVALEDGQEMSVGGVRLQAVHTPGHTPEHLSIGVSDTTVTDAPMMVLTADFVFVGDLGRPDLLEQAAGQQGAAGQGASQLFASLRDSFMALPDEALVWPGHGAGSACGKSLSSIPVSSVGYEAKHRWWGRLVGEGDERLFVEELLAEQPETPSYFRTMKELNRDGPDLLGELPSPPRLTPGRFRALRAEGAHIVDLRDIETFASRHFAGALNFPKLQSLSTHAGWVLPYDERPVVLVARQDQLEQATRRLVRIGQDRVAGYIPRLEQYVSEGELSSYPIATAKDAHRLWLRDQARIVDVRSNAEWQQGHIPGAIHVHFGQIQDHLDEIPKDQTLVVHCASGVRTNLAISQLLAHGYERVMNFPPGISGWKKAGYPVE